MSEIELPLNGTEQVEDIIATYPQAGGWLARHSVICTQCGEVFWGTLVELIDTKGKSSELDMIVEGLNGHLIGVG
jgi:hypothetical protein